MDSTIIKQLNELIEMKKDVALVTITKKEGSGPRGSGSMMVVDAAGNLLSGTIGGGSVEEHAKKDAAACIRKNISKAVHYDLSLKETEDSVGMACGGDVDVFIRVFKSADDLIIVGGGHIALDLAGFASALGYGVTVIDNRPEYASEERFPMAKQAICGEVEEVLKGLEIDESTSIVVVTHGHQYDKIALGAVLGRGARYVGMIGSRSKNQYCFDELRKEGFSDEQIKGVFAPIGLKIGGGTPAEISLAIMAEIQAVKYGKTEILSK